MLTILRHAAIDRWHNPAICFDGSMAVIFNFYGAAND